MYNVNKAVGMKTNAVASKKMYNEKRVREILTELACRSADVPVDMLPIPFDTELILDFGDEAVKDLKSKKEILKFERNWVDMVEEEELRQANLSKVEGMLKVMDSQIKLKEEMQEELKKEVPWKIVKLRTTFIGIEKSRKMFGPIHQELMTVLTRRDLDKSKIHQQKIMSEMLKELQDVASREFDNRNERLERRLTTWRVVRKDLMAVLTRRDHEKMKVDHQKKIMKEMLKELKVVALKDFEGRIAREEKRQAIHKELMAALIQRDQDKIKVYHQKKIMSEMLKELKVVALMDFEGRIAREEKRQAIHKELMKEVPRKIVKLRTTIIGIEKSRKMFGPIHQELMTVLTRRDQDKIKIYQQKKIMSEMLKQLKVVALMDFERRIAREEKRQDIHKELMAALIQRDQDKIKICQQKKIMKEMLKELKVVSSMDFEGRIAREEKRQAIHKELMIVLTKKHFEDAQFRKQQEMMSKMLKELKTSVLTKRNLEEKQFQILKALKSAMLTELKKLKKDNQSDLDKEEEDLFVPRKLFLFKVDTFKTSPQNVETENFHKRSLKNDHCAPSVEMVPTPAKKKSFGGRLRKFFGIK